MRWPWGGVRSLPAFGLSIMRPLPLERVIIAMLFLPGCAFTRMNKSLHEVHNESADPGSYALAGAMDVVTAPIQAPLLAGEAVRNASDPRKKFKWTGCPSCKSRTTPYSIAPHQPGDPLEITCDACGAKFRYSEKTGEMTKLRAGPKK